MCRPDRSSPPLHSLLLLLCFSSSSLLSLSTHSTLSYSLPSLSCSTNTIPSPHLPLPFNIYPHLSALCCTHPRLLGVREGTKPGFWRNLVGQGERWLILQVRHCHVLCPALCLLHCPVFCPVLCFFL
jgi:hypothetical protein